MDFNDKQEELTKQQKHQIWLKNSSYLYDRLVLQPLKWPSLTFQWLPTKQQIQSAVQYEFLYATHTSGAQTAENLFIAKVTFPLLKNIEDTNTEMPPTIMKKAEKFTHQIQINRARYCESNPSLIAAKTDDGPITIFKRGTQFPLILLHQQLSGGFALEWKSYGLITGDNNGKIAIWKDIQHQPTVAIWNSPVSDTRWINWDSFCSVGDDSNLCIWDQRSMKVQQAIPILQKGQQAYAVAVNPQNRNLIITAGQDCNIKLWDTRSLKKKLHNFEGHDNSVTTLDWSPVNTTMFASGSQDQKVRIWDLMRIGFEVPRQNTGYDQIVFTHEGHLGQVTDIGWNHHQMILGSTEQQKNTVQLYQISNNIHDLQYIQDLQYLRQQCYS